MLFISGILPSKEINKRHIRLLVATRLFRFFSQFVCISRRLHKNFTFGASERLHLWAWQFCSQSISPLFSIQFQLVVNVLYRRKNILTPDIGILIIKFLCLDLVWSSFIFLSVCLFWVIKREKKSGSTHKNILGNVISNCLRTSVCVCVQIWESKGLHTQF